MTVERLQKTMEHFTTMLKFIFRNRPVHPGFPTKSPRLIVLTRNFVQTHFVPRTLQRISPTDFSFEDCRCLGRTPYVQIFVAVYIIVIIQKSHEAHQQFNNWPNGPMARRLTTIPFEIKRFQVVSIISTRSNHPFDS